MEGGRRHDDEFTFLFGRKGIDQSEGQVVLSGQNRTRAKCYSIKVMEKLCISISCPVSFAAYAASCPPNDRRVRIALCAAEKRVGHDRPYVAAADLPAQLCSPSKITSPLQSTCVLQCCWVEARYRMEEK